MKVTFAVASKIPCFHDFDGEIWESFVIFHENQLACTATEQTVTCSFALLLRLAANITGFWGSLSAFTHFVLNVVRGRNVSLRQLG